MTTACPLCTAPEVQDHHADHDRRYFRCTICALVFLAPDQRLAADEEAERYRQHRNERGDPAYENFLRRLADPLVARLRPAAEGLDFGCGPTPVLAELLTAQGFPTAFHDPQFHPDARPLDRPYDFVTATEVMEHVFDPRAVLSTFARLLRNGGTLALMTRLYDGVTFATWWYRRDPTHVCFYCADTMRWIARDRGWTVSLGVPDVAIFSVPGA